MMDRRSKHLFFLFYFTDLPHRRNHLNTDEVQFNMINISHNIKTYKLIYMNCINDILLKLQLIFNLNGKNVIVFIKKCLI